MLSLISKCFKENFVNQRKVWLRFKKAFWSDLGEPRRGRREEFSVSSYEQYKELKQKWDSLKKYEIKLKRQTVF